MRFIVVFALSTLLFLTSASQLRRTTLLNVSVSGTPLPPAEQAKLRKVENDVKSLEQPHAPVQSTSSESAPVSTPQSSTSSCNLLSGLVTAQISGHCCKSAQVVTQRQLKEYGIAQKCKPEWQCENDGVTPVATFEKQSLSSMCGEPGCLPAVVAAFKSNVLTAKGANEMSGICTTLTSMGGANADAEAVSQVLTGGSKERKECKRLHCSDDDTAKKWCDEKDNESHNCHQYCCAKDSQCFPGEATVQLDNRGRVPLAEVKPGDKVLVSNQNKLSFEPILSFLHIVRNQQMPHLIVKHVHGEFRVSATHIVFVSMDAEGLSVKSKLAGSLIAGDRILANTARSSTRLTPSLVLAIEHGTTQTGMYAPLTDSGTIVVDSVLASNYASSSQRKHLSHSLAHKFLFPVRLYHRIGIATLLSPVWQWLCPQAAPPVASTNLLCQGQGLSLQSEELHPYLQVMWKALKLDMLL